jgi:RNA polymerase sigma-54 factor
MALVMSQRPILNLSITPYMAQTVKLIELPIVELRTWVQSELESNPALEVLQDSRFCMGCGKQFEHSVCPTCDRKPAENGEPTVKLSAFSLNDSRFVESAAEKDYRAIDGICVSETLSEHILRQIGPMLSVEDRSIAEYLVANIDDRGFLTESPAQSAQHLGASVSRVETVLGSIQEADPPGIGARDPRESLLLQLEALEQEGSDCEIARKIIADHFESLCQCNLSRISRALRVSLEEVEAATAFIRQNLTPYPARVFWGNRYSGISAERSQGYKQPDAIISGPLDGENGPLIVEVFSPISGPLRVDPALKDALKECPAGEREHWQPYIERAQLVVNSLERRNRTICQLLQVIVREQRAFILRGDGDLKPMTRARMADLIDVHESTVSRAVADKTIALPNGRIIPLSKFFDRSLAIRHAVKTIVANEDRPLTDGEIVVELATQGYRVARRTVAKYRAMENILAASMR